MTTNIEYTPATQTSRSTLSRLLWLAPLAMAAATVANLGLYALAGSLLPEVAAWPGAGPAHIVGANVVYLLIGAAALAVLARISANPARHYLIVASVGLALSLALPISAGLGYGAPGAPPAGVATVITLSLMHVVSYAISVPLYIRYALD